MNVRSVASVVGAALLLGGCGGSGAPTPTVTVTSTRVVTPTAPGGSAAGGAPPSASATTSAPAAPATSAAAGPSPTAPAPTAGGPQRGASGTPSPQGRTATFGRVTQPMIEIARPEDADQLPDTPGLRAFARAQLAESLRDNPGCEMALTVDRLDPLTSASVGEFGPDCGGGQSFWGTKGGRWVKVWSGQDVPTCDELRAVGATLNPDVVGRCATGSGAGTRRYRP